MRSYKRKNYKPKKYKFDLKSVIGLLTAIIWLVIEILKRIRALEQNKNLSKEDQAKIIMVTASSEKETIVECLRSSCDDYIIKPFNRGTIFAKLEKIGFPVASPEEHQAASSETPASST